jgi:hypothetical protein
MTVLVGLSGRTLGSREGKNDRVKNIETLLLWYKVIQCIALQAIVQQESREIERVSNWEVNLIKA